MYGGSVKRPRLQRCPGCVCKVLIKVPNEICLNPNNSKN